MGKALKAMKARKTMKAMPEELKRSMKKSTKFNPFPVPKRGKARMLHKISAVKKKTKVYNSVKYVRSGTPSKVKGLAETQNPES